MKSLVNYIKEESLNEGLFGGSNKCKYEKHGWSDNPLADSIMFLTAGGRNSDVVSGNEAKEKDEIAKEIENIIKEIKVTSVGYVAINSKTDFGKSVHRKNFIEYLKQCNFGKIEKDARISSDNKIFGANKKTYGNQFIGGAINVVKNTIYVGLDPKKDNVCRVIFGLYDCK